MRSDRALVALLCVVSSGVGCGANVVVDGAAPGSTGGSSSTSGAGVTCDNLSGEGLQGGGCETDGICNGRKIVVQCSPAQAGATCTCVANGTAVGSCDDPRSLPNAQVCDPTSGCCATVFGW